LQQIEEKRHATERNEGISNLATQRLSNRFRFCGRILVRFKPANANIAGPKVISRNKSEGGYLVVFRNERRVNTAELCEDQ
jgi:hypothetical protein